MGHSPQEARRLETLLGEAGYRTAQGGGPEAGLEVLESHAPDLVLADAGLLAAGGTDFLRRVEAAAGAPVLILAQKAAPEEAVLALDAGADDYLPGDMDGRELLARIRRSLRRGPAPGSGELSCRDLRLYPAARRVLVGETPVELTVREFDLLEFFLRHPGIALTRNQLLNGVWGYDFYGDAKVVDVYVRYLRQKLDARFGRPYIATVRGIGYRLIK